jgi:O-antigen/teichoic acid export membrane protein
MRRRRGSMTGAAIRGKEKHLKVLILSIVSLALVGSVKILFNMIVGRSFGTDSVEVLGMTSVVLSLALLITTLCSTGFVNIASKFISDALSRNEAGRARRLYEIIIKDTVILSLVSAGIIGALSTELSTILNVDLIYFAFAVPIIIVASLYYVLRSTFYALGAVTSYFKREIIADSAFFGVLAGVILLGSAGLILLSFVVMYLIFLILSFMAIHKRLPPNQAHMTLRMKEEYAFGGLSTLGTVMSVAVTYLGNIFVGAMLGAYSAGIFAAALTTANLALLIENGFAQVLIPEIAFLWGAKKSEELRKDIMTWTMTLALSAAIFIGPMIILSRDALSLLFGFDYLIGMNVVIIMLIGTYMLTIGRTSLSALVATDKLKLVAIVSAVATTAAITSWAFLIPLWGIEGAAFGYLIACSFNTIIPLVYAREKWTLDLKPLIIPNLSFALLIIAIVALTGLDNFYERLISAVCFVLIYIAINYHKIRSTLISIRKR